MKKLYAGMMLGCALFSSGLDAAGNVVSTEQVTAMQKQIEMLQKQLSSLTKQVAQQEAQVAKQAAATKAQISNVAVAANSEKSTATIASQSSEPSPVFDAGYIAMPGTNSAVKISGLIKLDTIYDLKNQTGEQAIPSFVPYLLQIRGSNNKDNKYNWNRHFYMHGKQSKICIDAINKNASGKDIKGRFEGDFFGSTQFSNPGTNGAANSSSLNYSFRLRHAFLDYNGWTAGFTTTTFHMTDALLPSVDLNGICAGNMFRQPLLRYTYGFNKSTAISLAIENPKVDYITYHSKPTANTANYSYLGRDASNNHGKPTRPDIIAKIQHTFANKSMIGLSAIQRDLSIKYNNNNANSDGKKYTANGYGINLTGKVITFGDSFLTGGYIQGRGLGQYIIEMAGRSAIFSDISDDAKANRRYRTLPMYQAWVGYSHAWNKQFQTNVGASYSQLRTRLNATRSPVNYWIDPGLDKTFRRLLVNTIYKPENNFEVGLEYMFIKRQSTLNYKAIGNRMQLGLSYKF